MAVHTTRMLLLGAVAMFEPVNGYQIRRELVSWRVDEWANLGPGSIYSGLTTLEKLGQVVRHDVLDEGRSVAVYEITAMLWGTAWAVGLFVAAVWWGTATFRKENA